MSIILSKAGTKFIQDRHNLVDCNNNKPYVPKLPVWKYDRCYSYSEWKELNKDDILDIVKQVIEYISYVNENLENEEIHFKDSDIRNIVETHLYNTSLNVKRKFKKLH